MAEIEYIDLEKGQCGYAIVKIEDRYAVIEKMFTCPKEAMEKFKEYELPKGRYELTDIVRK